MTHPANATRAASAGRRAGGRSGFTLVEILAAVAILVLLVAMMATIFKESDRAWIIGTGRAANSNEGRAALSMIAHDLQYAVADELLTFHMGPDRDRISSYGFTNDEICCVSLQYKSSEDAPRTAREIFIYVRPRQVATALGTTYTSYELVRHSYGKDISDQPASSSMHCYTNRLWYLNPSDGGVGRSGAGGVIAENVVGFHAAAGPASRVGGVWTMPHAYDSIAAANGNQLPEYVDLYLEILNERDAAEVAKMWHAGAQARARDFIEKNAKRYSTRVFFQNRIGYKKRG